MFDATLPSSPNVIVPDEEAPQRSRGTLDLEFAAGPQGSRPIKLFQEGSLRVRFPNVPATSVPEGVIVNVGGGLTGGDRLKVGVKLRAGAALTITGQACEKIYKSSGGAVQIAQDLSVAAKGHLEWLLQPSIIFDRSRLERKTTVHLAPDATLLAVESLIFGRLAMGESVISGFVSDGWRIRRGERLNFADTLRLDGPIADLMARPSVMRGYGAVATVIYVALDAEARCEEMRGHFSDLSGTAAASAWNGILVTRFAASDGYDLTHDLVKVLSAFRARPMPRVWMI